MAGKNIKTNIKFLPAEYRPLKEVEFNVPIDTLVSRIKLAKWIGLDTETYAKDFDREAMEDQFIADRMEENKKITATTHKSAAKYAEDYRNECALDPQRSSVRLMQVLLPTKEIFLVDLFLLTTIQTNNLMKAISNKPLIGQNLKFDLKVLLQNFPVFTPGEVWDTMIGYKIHRTAEIVGFFKADLASIVRYYLSIQLEKQEGISDWSQKILTAAQLKYSYLDVKYLEEIKNFQLHVLNTRSLYRTRPEKGYWNNELLDVVSIIEMEFVPVLAGIELAGIPINVPALTKRAADFKKELHQLKKPFDKAGVSTTSPAQIMEFITKNTDADIMGTSKEELGKYIHIPLVVQILKVKKMQKELQMIEDYIGKHLHKDGRLYASYNQMRAASGRMSSVEPNAQQFPRAIKNIIYLSTAKRKIIRGDLPAIEMRIMSVIANDQAMKKIFIDKKDPHTTTAASILKKNLDQVTKDERDKAKPPNFGLQYGMGAKTFVEYSFNNFGVIYTLKQAMEIRELYLNTYKGVRRYHINHGNRLAENPTIQVQTLLGRRVMVDSFTIANNTPVQGSGADIIKLAANLFMKYCKKEKLDARIINIVHDELVVDCATKHKTKVAALLKKSLEVATNFAIPDFITEVQVDEVKEKGK